MSDNSGSSKPRESGASDESLVQAIRGWLKTRRRAKSGESVRETLEELFEDREEEDLPIDEHERRLLGNILHLRDLSAYDVMVPRADITGVDSKITLEELIEVIHVKGHSRFPVYRGTLDDAVGLVHIKDVLMMVASGKPFALQRIVRKILFISPSIRVMDLLLEMRLKRTHMALVVDEYGGIDGLVTIEDLVEQIVGEIEDEHDREIDPDFIRRPDGVVEVDARLPLEEFETHVGKFFEDEEIEDIDTLGGLVFSLAGRVPSRGELITHDLTGIEFEIVDADPRRIKRLRLRNLPKIEDSAS
ncbi:MAG TPA: hemolysin family protein [Candidatus Sulfotelmatobacter sp.]|jgi:CBS domain containing-hemolysin-like protein|nr:hemolysin family protein [Candidatus Sulfotelmatobacter sp.]